VQIVLQGRLIIGCICHAKTLNADQQQGDHIGRIFFQLDDCSLRAILFELVAPLVSFLFIEKATY
jgi:hypothetical protein